MKLWNRIAALFIFLAMNVVVLMAQAGAPVKVLGQYTCTQSQDVQDGHQLTRVTGVGPVTLQNMSTKRIITFVVNIDANCGDIGARETYQHDMIFKATGISPGDMSMPLPVDVDEGRTGDVHFNPAGSLSVTPLYVQFEDGSAWGDTSYAAKFKQARADAVQWQTMLRAITDDDQFNAALNAPVPTGSMVVYIQRSLQMTRDLTGIIGVRATIDDRMATYNARISNGNF